MEIWKEIIGYESLYEVSDNGNIRKGNQILKKHKIQGRHVIRLFKKGKYKAFCVAKLVANYFIPNTDNKRFVSFKNGNKLDDRAENLLWTNEKKFNTNIKSGENHGMSILNEIQVKEIRDLRSKKKTYQEIADAYNVSIGCIQGVVQGSNWKNVV